MSILRDRPKRVHERHRVIRVEDLED